MHQGAKVGASTLPKLQGWLFCSLVLLATGLTARAENQEADASKVSPTISLQELEAECKPRLTGGCDLIVSTMRRISLSNRERIPESLKMHFSANGGLLLSEGSLDFGGTTIDAPLDRQVFFGEGRILGLAVGRPEWFAEGRDGTYPREALLGAYNATRGRGTILLKDRAYISPFFDPHSIGSCGGKTVRVDALSVDGADRPVPDNLDAPTRLVNGSVILGEICGTGPVHLQHLGVDEGPYVVKHDFAGVESYGIALLGGATLGAIAGTSIVDVSVLTTGLKDQHSVIIEGQREARVKDLWIWTRGGTHGLVMKSFGSTIENLHCSGAASTCLILKSDYMTDHAGVASDTRVDGVYLHWLQEPGDTAGIELDGRWDSLERLTLQNIHEEGLSYGIVGHGSALHRVTQVRIDDWHAAGMRGTCLILSADHVQVDDFSCVQANPSSGPAMTLDGHDLTLRRGSIGCVGIGCGDTTKDGVIDLGIRNRVEQLVGRGLGGYLVRTSLNRGGTAVRGLDATRMGARVSTVNVVQRVTLQQRKLDIVAKTKPLLRILFTQFMTDARFLLGTRNISWVGGFGVLLAAFAVSFARHFRKG